MSFTKILDLSGVVMLTLWIGIFLILTIFGLVKKKSFFNLITLLLSIAFLIIHIVLKESFGETISSNVIIDFISIIISIALYLYIDEIEARREVISEVFENRYKNRRKK